MSLITEDSAVELGTIILRLREASKIPAKRRTTNAKALVQDLTSRAYDQGVQLAELEELIDLVIRPNHLDQASLAAIVRNLYPSIKVPDDVVLKVVGSLGLGQLKPSLTIQGLLLRWLILVYHLLRNQAVLSQTYAVLFNLLDTAAVRPQICHLLALITRRKHVRPFRIQAILGLSRQTGTDAALLGLLRVYKNYYPEVIVGEATRGRASPFKHPDPQWRERVDEIQLAHLQRTQSEASGPQNGFRVQHSLQKTTRKSNIPSVHTSHATETSITLEEIDTVQDLVQKIEKIEMPNQLIAVLADPLLQKLMLLRPGDEGYRRVEHWISACVADAASGDITNGELLDMVEVLHDYVLSIKSVVQEVLKSWDGQDRRSALLEVMSFAPISEFSTLYETLFKPLEGRLLNNTPESQLHLLGFYTMLLHHWTVFLLSDDIPAHASSTIRALLEHVNKLSLTLLQTLPSASTQLQILDFFERVTAIMSRPDLLAHVQITIPPPPLVYILHFSQSLAVLSRLCGILAVYKKNLEVAMSRPANRQLGAYERENVNTFNGFLMDICNCLWRGRAFAVSDANALGCRIPQSLLPSFTSYMTGLDRELVLGSSFGISHSPTLCLQSISHLRSLEDAEIDSTGGELYKRHAGPVTQSSLAQLGTGGGLDLSWQAYRSGVLQHLEDNSLEGIPNLLYNTMKNLKNSRPT
ncbi:uncharacterized protein E0L32_008173 [Thyridium curvatum]|uniref:Centromere protein I n=1 Tax=Thyridium curvatum TaxID=1093900 RepID=A0A507AU07_9PEZI|nr:uncharacterized protein E0L32_008173 [Thyridium curvatum]TPX10967.1 hypothetical protein E0L32_008173 [Thyridium curvatum]